MVDHGFLPLLTDFEKMDDYWRQILVDFPGHPAHGQEKQAIPLSLYGSLDNHQIYFNFWVLFCGT